MANDRGQLKEIGEPTFQTNVIKALSSRPLHPIMQQTQEEISYETKASGIAPEVGELDVLIEEMLEKEEASEKIRQSQSNKNTYIPLYSLLFISRNI